MCKRTTKKTTEAKSVEEQQQKKKLSLLSAAAEVLKASDEPLNCGGMISLAKEKGLWEPTEGKTPEQTLYSAIVREIKEKGERSRFKKSDLRGHYSWANPAN
jgi:hypothetical protein